MRQHPLLLLLLFGAIWGAIMYLAILADRQKPWWRRIMEAAGYGLVIAAICGGLLLWIGGGHL